jgi:hypothetical protein
MLISVLAPTGDKTTDKYLISKGEKGVELTFEDLRTLARYYVSKGPTVPIIEDFKQDPALHRYTHRLTDLAWEMYEIAAHGGENGDPWDDDDHPNAVLVIGGNNDPNFA